MEIIYPLEIRQIVKLKNVQTKPALLNWNHLKVLNRIAVCGLLNSSHQSKNLIYQTVHKKKIYKIMIFFRITVCHNWVLSFYFLLILESMYIWVQDFPSASNEMKNGTNDFNIKKRA